MESGTLRKPCYYLGDIDYFATRVSELIVSVCEPLVYLIVPAVRKNGSISLNIAVSLRIVIGLFHEGGGAIVLDNWIDDISILI